jgi:hypothetical protein
LDRATDYESVGREFESLRARHKINSLQADKKSALAICQHKFNTRRGELAANDNLSSQWVSINIHSALVVIIKLP